MMKSYGIRRRLGIRIIDDDSLFLTIPKNEGSVFSKEKRKEKKEKH